MKIGDTVTVTKDILDDGEDCHPPGVLCKKGEVLVIREINEGHICVSHERRTDSSFRLYDGEYVND